ncbi:MAG: hypothetical protein B7Z33_13060 [Sphingomonadales bacterium 12-68-11]|nr:MAG: hypothetical protein B7Z33_13060 [Sphingomonadales bacterium 12-68-11]
MRQRAGAEAFCAAWDTAIDRAISRVETQALARAIDGEERLVVSAGKVLGVERRYNESLVMFLLKSRRAVRYGEEIGPGHPLYERIRAQVLAEELGDEREVLDSIDRMIDAMRARAAENARVIAESAEPLDEASDAGGAEGA